MNEVHRVKVYNDSLDGVCTDLRWSHCFSAGLKAACCLCDGETDHLRGRRAVAGGQLRVLCLVDL